tara:strand:+ start:37869 stop:39359 length:1491 start_codon:yes stop_codon:yes gene_type:complete
MKKLVLLLVFLIPVISCTAQEKKANKTEEYTLVTYNVENLFDADGSAVFDDYKSTDTDGNDLYTKEDLLTKIQNIVQVLKEYNEGKGPDIAVLVELESDYTPNGKVSYADAGDFLGRYSYTTLVKMLGSEFDENIADLSSEWLLLKGMVDAGMWNYQVEVGYSGKDEKGLPITTQKTAVFSRFPILKEKTQIHPIQQARPILETWIDVVGNELVVFANHWKSGASSWEMEQIRIQNAEVLRARLDELIIDNPKVDFVLAGDFNSDYNQKVRYEFEKTAINDVLGSSDTQNLWYYYPITHRGSDTYRGYWGTLMQIIISKSMLDDSGFSYVNDSFDRGDFGFNTFSTSGEPKRWSSTFSGSGYSDHLPISMKFQLALGGSELPYPYDLDDIEWKPIPVSYNIPTEFLTETEFTSTDPTTNQAFFNEYFYLTAMVTDDYDFVVNGRTYDAYTPSFRLNEILSGVKGTDKEIKFYGRFSQFRGNWQFVVEDPSFIEIAE